MTHKLLVLSDVFLTRELSSFAMSMGIQMDMADAMAQVHIRNRRVAAERWNDLYIDNCRHCIHDPSDCGFFNPRPEDCHAGVGPANVRQANMALLSAGRIRQCPVFTPRLDALQADGA